MKKKLITLLIVWVAMLAVFTVFNILDGIIMRFLGATALAFILFFGSFLRGGYGGGGGGDAGGG